MQLSHLPNQHGMAMLNMRWSALRSRSHTCAHRVPRPASPQNKRNAVRNTYSSAITARRSISAGGIVVNTDIVVIVVTLLRFVCVKTLLLLLLLYSFTCIYCSFNTNIYLILIYTCFCSTCNINREKSRFY